MIQFSTDDLRTPESLELVLRQFVAALTPVRATTTTPASVLDTNALISKLAPLLRDQLQAPGAFPLNLQSLLPNAGQAILLEDTHSNRLTLYPPGNYAVGTVFYETDRTVLYAIVLSSGVLVWQYIGGTYTTTHTNRPVDLSTTDTGFLLQITTQAHLCMWRGASWIITDAGGGYIVDSPFALLALGWQLCDGTVTDYLTISGADLALTAFTTPDEVTAPSGVYHKSIAVYTGTINAASSGSFNGSPATLTGNVSAPIFTGTPGVTSGPSTSTTATTGANGVADAVHTHTITPAGTNSAPTLTMDSYTPAGTIATTGQPRNLGVLRYFRR